MFRSQQQKKRLAQREQRRTKQTRAGNPPQEKTLKTTEKQTTRGERRTPHRDFYSTLMCHGSEHYVSLEGRG